jgi:hypothetical protein
MMEVLAVMFAILLIVGGLWLLSTTLINIRNNHLPTKHPVPTVPTIPPDQTEEWKSYIPPIRGDEPWLP